jgi:hypothetical protein
MHVAILHMIVNYVYMWGKKKKRKPYASRQYKFFLFPLQRTGMFPSRKLIALTEFVTVVVIYQGGLIRFASARASQQKAHKKPIARKKPNDPT